MRKPLRLISGIGFGLTLIVAACGGPPAARIVIDGSSPVHPITQQAAITVAELKTLWEPAAHGRVKTLSQVRKGWPDREIHLYGPDAQSGTFDYFTEAIAGQPKASRKDYAANADRDLAGS